MDWKKPVVIAAGLTTVLTVGALMRENVELGLQTDEEAQVWRSDHILTEAEKFKVDRIDRVTRESDRIEYDLLDDNLAFPQRSFKERQLLKNDAKIKCIQEDKCQFSSGKSISVPEIFIVISRAAEETLTGALRAEAT